MARRGKAFELLVAYLEESLGPSGIEVKSPEFFKGKKSGSRREVDITLRSRIGSAEILMIIECRKRKDKQDVRWLEQVYGKCEDIIPDKAIAVSETPFTSGAENYAEKVNIELRTLSAIKPDEIMKWFEMKELKVEERHVSFKDVGIRVSLKVEGEKLTFHSSIIRFIKPSLNVNAKIFERTKDRKKLCLLDIWNNLVLKNNRIYEGVEPDGEEIKRRFMVHFESNDLMRIKTDKGKRGIGNIEIVAMISIRTKRISPTSARLYRNSEKVISRMAEYDFDVNNVPLIFGMHRNESSGEQSVTIRRREKKKKTNKKKGSTLKKKS